MNTVAELSRNIGKRANVAIEQTLRIECTILNARQAFGRTDYLITPIAGSGEQWVDSARVMIHEGYRDNNERKYRDEV